MQATFTSSTARSRPVLIALTVAILCLLSLFGLANHSQTLDNLSISNYTQSILQGNSRPGFSAGKTNRDVLLYAYYETDDAKRNFQFFLDHALHNKIDFIIIVNGDNLSIEIPVADNVKVIRRPNTCFDLGTFGEVLQADDSALRKKYDRFILINSSIRGPFLPAWARSIKTCWSDIYFNSLTEETKLVGISANCDPDHRKHLQSMLLSVDQMGLDLIMPSLQCQETLWDAVMYGETALTMLVREAGYKAEPLYSLRHKHYYEDSEDFWEHCDNMDIFFPERLDGMDIHPFDAIFVKTDRKENRATYTEQGQLAVDKMTQWVDASRYSSYDYC